MLKLNSHRWSLRTVLALLLILTGLSASPPNAAAFGGLSDEAVVVWQHRDSPTAPTGWDILYSVLGRATPTSTLTWHASGGPVPEAAPIATLSGDDKNPHIGTNAGVTIAVWQHAPGTDSSPGDWDIFFSQLNTTTGTWSTPAAVATLSGDDYDPNVSVDSNGNAIAVWIHRNPDETRDVIFSLFTAATGTWSPPAALPVGASGGQASLPEVTITSVASVAGPLAHRAVAAWSDVPPSAAPSHRILYAIFDGASWTAPAEVESASTGIAVSIGNVGFATYSSTDPDPFGAFGRLGVTADASGNAYVVWGGGPTILGLGSPGVVGAILNVAANTWQDMCTFGTSPCLFARFIGVGGCENPDDALTTGGGDFVGVFNFAGFIEHTFRTGGIFTGETASYDSPLDDQRPSNAAISATEMISVNWGAPGGAGSEIIWSVGTVVPGSSVAFGPANNLVPGGLTGEDMFPEIASGFAASLITGFSLTPATATNPVGTTHTVTPTVTTGGSPVPGITVSFTVSGANTASGSCVTDASGQCSFTYTGTNAGTDTFTATAVVSGVVQTATAAKIWEGAEVPPGRMTGGGSVISGASDIPANQRVTHGFELHCDATEGPNNLQINFGKGNRFHLKTLTSATCSLDTSIGAPNPPAAGFNKYVGSGTGQFNGVSGALITFELTDEGEPGNNDHVHFHISVGATTVLSVDGHLHHGNHQAHAQ